MTGAATPPRPFRWTAARKDEFLARWRRAGVDARAAMLAESGLTDAEVAGWERRHRDHGQAGLKTTRLKEFR